MIGRALLRFPARARLLHPTPVVRCPQDGAVQLPIVLAVRSYATPGRPKKVVGEPSRPVKRAVKKAASQPLSGDSAAEQILQTRKSAAKKKKKTTKRAKPTLSPEQQAAKEEKAALKKEKAKISDAKKKLVDLRRLALKPPKKSTAGAYKVLFSEKMKNADLTGKTPAQIREAMGNMAREVSAQWRTLTAAEIEHYNHLANVAKEASHAEYKRWVESHPAEEIKKANNARIQLRGHMKSTGKRLTTRWDAIRDERTVKRPISAYLSFVSNRFASGDFKNIGMTDSSKLISAEWKALSEDERTKFINLFNQDRNRYYAEYNDTYGHAPPPSRTHGNGRAEAVAAAA